MRPPEKVQSMERRASRRCACRGIYTENSNLDSFTSMNPGFLLALVTPISFPPFGERRARPFPSRVAGHAQRCGQYGASREGVRSQGGRGGEERGRNRPAQPARDAGNREAGFGSARGNSLALARQSDALVGSRARTGSAHPLRSKDVRRRPANGVVLLPILKC